MRILGQQLGRRLLCRFLVVKLGLEMSTDDYRITGRRRDVSTLNMARLRIFNLKLLGSGTALLS
jgi:hypothetical protein